MEEIVRKVETRESEPRAGNQDGVRREIVIQVEAETLERQRKLARVQSGSGSAFEMLCDEGTRIGGDDTAPSPLAYFSAGVAF
ncbi:MAG: hypothetical protein OXL97_02155 [Chloroflexota bacterium]|nr:hypothetical protein [Chloroflexota bacterium]MDE2884783.1 hypothetical protein [Chloroflexota bacterium]